MRFISTILKVGLVLLVVLLTGYFFSHPNLGKSVKGMSKRTSKVTATYLGSVHFETTLANLVPEEDRESVQLKEEWLRMQVDWRVSVNSAVSENGKYKVLKSFFPEPAMEGLVEAVFVDNNGNEIWRGTTGSYILVSNNGKNFTAQNPLDEEVCLYDITASSESLNCIGRPYAYTFSQNGEYLISAGSVLALRKADGTLIWEKNTGTGSSKKVVIASDASYIVMGSSSVFGHPEPKITEVTQTKKREKPPTIQSENTFKPHEEKTELIRKEVKEQKEGKSFKKDSSARRERKIYLCFLKGDGTLIEQKTLPYRIVQNLSLSPDGAYAAVSCDSTVMFFETETGTLLWKYEFPNVYWLVTSMVISNNGDIIALGIISNRGDALSPRYLYHLNKQGDEILNFELKKPSVPERAPVVTFTDEEEYLLVATPSEKHCLRITRPK